MVVFITHVQLGQQGDGMRSYTGVSHELHLALSIVLLDVFLAKQCLHACLGAHATRIISHQLLVSAQY